MQGIYRNIEGGYTDYLDWRELFDQLAVIYESDAEREDFWDEFLRAFKLRMSDPRSVSRETFYSDSGIPKERIDWGLWRDVMGS
jgi:hypothetical protein